MATKRAVAAPALSDAVHTAVTDWDAEVAAAQREAAAEAVADSGGRPEALVWQALVDWREHRVSVADQRSAALVSDHPDHADAWALRAIVLATKREYAQALHAVDRARMLVPGSEELIAARALGLALAGDRPHAEEEAAQVQRLAPVSFVSSLLLEQAYEHLGDAASAVSTAQAAVAADPELPAAWSLLAAAHLYAGQRPEALEACHEALRRDPRHHPSLARRSFALSELHHFQEAIAAAEEAIDAYDADPEPHVALGYAHVCTARELDRWAGTQRRRGALVPAAEATQRADAEYDAALAHFDRAIRVDRWQASAYVHRGIALGACGRYDEALLDFQTACDMAPGGLPPRLLVGQARLELEDPAGAREAFVHATEMDAGNADAWAFRGEAERRCGLLDDAVESLRRALDIDRVDADAWDRLGQAYRDLGRHRAAVGAFRMAWRYDRDRPRAPVRATAELLELDEPKEALELATTAVKEGNDRAELRFNRVLALERLGRRAEAREELRHLARRQRPPEDESEEETLERAREKLRASAPAPEVAGAWIDYWFGGGASRARKCSGALMVAAAAAIAFLVATQEVTMVDVLPAIVAIGLLFLLPTVASIGLPFLKVETRPLGAALGAERHPTDPALGDLNLPSR